MIRLRSAIACGFSKLINSVFKLVGHWTLIWLEHILFSICDVEKMYFYDCRCLFFQSGRTLNSDLLGAPFIFMMWCWEDALLRLPKTIFSWPGTISSHVVMSSFRWQCCGPLQNPYALSSFHFTATKRIEILKRSTAFSVRVSYVQYPEKNHKISYYFT